MGGYAQFCIQVMIGWLRSVISQIWSIFSGRGNSSFLAWAGNNWKYILLVICAVGALADLAVYLFRWEPYKVWKSYFNRRKKHKNIPLYAETGVLYYGYDMPEKDPGSFPGYSENFPAQGMEYPDQDHPDTFYPEIPEAGIYPPDPYGTGGEREMNPADTPQSEALPQKQPVYMAPNSPTPPEYRQMYSRPASTNRLHIAGMADGRSLTERNLEKVIGPRRRKVRVSQLLSDPDEFAVHYEAPQPVIDRLEAYHAPVYPKNWKENGEDPS